MAEAMLQARKVTSPGCCGVNLGHRHSCQVIKGHGKTIHHTLSEDWPGQTQSQNSSDLAELREERLFPRKKLKKKTPKKKKPRRKTPQQHKTPIPLPLSANPVGSGQTGATHITAEGSREAACFPEQQEKSPPPPKGWAPGAWCGCWHPQLPQQPRRTKATTAAICRWESPE